MTGVVRRLFERLRRTILAGSIVATVALGVWVGASVVRFCTEGWWLAVLIAIPLGAVAIDFLTGLVHWACDCFGDPATPFVGPLLIRAFREHHLVPGKMLEHDAIETNGESCVLTVLALAVLAASASSVQSWLAAALTTFVWTMAVIGAWANQVHKWAHSSKAPRGARFLQGLGLVLRPDAHACHHRAPYDSGYCISTGWMNPLLDRLEFWSWLECLLRRGA